MTRRARFIALLVARHKAHAALDPIWQQQYMSRNEAYEWLARECGLTRDEAHIRFFDVGMCEAVVDLARAKLRLLKRGRNQWRRERMKSA
jgi:hypothetical protein